MESSENDRGVARDVVEQPSTRENKEMLSGGGEVCSLITTNRNEGEHSRTMERSANSALDEDGLHNTETILNMIDEFIDEPKCTKSAKYFADSTVRGNSPTKESTTPSDSIGDSDKRSDNQGVNETNPEDNSPENATGNRSHVKDKQLEDMVNDISSSSTMSGSACDIGDNSMCDPIESCSKTENLPGQRRKLIRPTSSKEVNKISVKIPEEHCSIEDKQDVGPNNESPTQSSPKKVKLVRHSSVKSKPQNVVHTSLATPLTPNISTSDTVSERLQCHKDSSDSNVKEPLDSHSVNQCLVNAHDDSVTNRDSDIKQASSVSKLDSTQVNLTNSVSEQDKDGDCVDINKTNDVLDVRKVSPLRLSSRSVIDESLHSNNKLHTTLLNVQAQHNDISANQNDVDECRNVPKLTLKLGSKPSDQSKECGKVSRLHIKPIKPLEDSTHDSPVCSKSKHSEDEHSIPNVVKLNIKPIHKPEEVESDAKDMKSSSSSSEVSECESSENEVTNECIQSPTVETTECERAVPKLTIKSLSTTPKVDTETHKHRARRSQSPEPPVVHKLNIKPIVPPPIEKMTIKLHKSHEPEAKSESESVHAESVPKMTIKLGKDNTSVIENNCDDDKSDSVLKMKIKLAKCLENSVDINSDSPSEHCPVTRSSKRLNQKQEHIAEQHVPKLTIKIPQEHEAKSYEKCSTSPSIPKLTIKPILKPEELERSSSPTVPKLTIKPIPKPEDHDVRNDDSVEHPTIPKLTIKPILKSDEHDIERSSSPNITKLHIKPVVKPDELESTISEPVDSHSVPKITIKTVKADDHDSRYNESPIPKLTIKPIVKHDDVEAEVQTLPKVTIKPVIQHDEIVENEITSVPKLTIKPLVKPDQTVSETETHITKLNIKPIVKPGDVVEMEPIPKITIKPVVKHDDVDAKHLQGPSSPSIPKVTIKPIVKPNDSPSEATDTPVSKITIKNINKLEEQELRRSERCASPSVPKLTIKPILKPGAQDSIEVSDVPVVHKLTIKPIVKPDEHIVESKDSSNTLSKSVISPDDDGHITKLSIKPILKASVSETVESVSVKPEEVTVRTRSKTSLDETINKLNSRARINSEINSELNNDTAPKLDNKSCQDSTDCSGLRFTIKAVTEEMVKPLEVVTSPVKSSPSHQQSGLDSPRIILKINKCPQGAVSEIVDEVQKKPDISKSKEIHNDIEVSKHVDSDKETKKDIEKPVVETKEACVKENDIQDKHVNDVQHKEVNDESNEVAKENNETITRTSVKRTRSSMLNKISDKSTPVHVKRQKLDNAITNLLNKNRKNAINVPLISSKEESIMSNKNGSNSESTCNSTEGVLSNNGENNFKDVLSSIKNKEKDTVETSNSFISKVNDALAEGDSNTTSTRSSEDLSESNQQCADSPIFSKVEKNMLVLNDETNSQECMMIDELSQDPLDIESAAKSHFATVTASITPIMSIKDTIKIVEQTPQDIAVSLGLTPQPKKRGRPRKNPLPEGQTPTTTPAPTPVKPPKQLPTPALEERPVRVLRTPREKPAILRTPRTRGGRGRGGNRRGAANSNTREVATSPPDSPVDRAIKFFTLASHVTTTQEETPPTNTTPCKVTLARLENDGSGEEEEESEVVGRSVGRGGRGGRRGGRGSRGGRGKGSRGGLLKGGQRGEEVQLQDALPLASPIRREGRKSKLEPTLTPALQVFEEETCMIGDNATPKRHIGLVDDESQSSVLSGQTASESGTRSNKRPKLMDMLDEGHKEWTPGDVAEYDWPLDGSEPPQTCMIQEQVALYLGVKSFKRRYPDLKRRALSADEKNYLRDRGLISEALCDLGVTAVDAGEVLDIMFMDYPDKYEEYRKHLRERRENKQAGTAGARFTLPPTLAKVSKQEILEKACESAMSWNAQLNKQRKSQRTTSMDLQTLTLHRPKRPPVVQERDPTTLNFYPVALLPGQFTDYYRDYTTEELRYFPLNTVMEMLPSPKPPPEVSSDESESNSESEHSSGGESESEASVEDSSNTRRKAPISKAKSRQSTSDVSRPISPSNDSTQAKTETSVSNIKCEEAPSTSSLPNRCKICEGAEFSNRNRNPNEAFITCATCQKKIHPYCLELTTAVAKCLRAYDWQCADCKCCGQCGDLADDDKMLFCDLCDRGYHIYCVGLKKVPTGRWHCVHCAVCRSCGSKSPSGPQGLETSGGVDSVPDQWHHHFRRTNSGQRIYSHTLCAPCAKAWRLGLFCPSCEKCFVGRKGAMGLVICVRCDMRYHQECIRKVRNSLDVLNFLCTHCRRGIAPKHKQKLRRAERTPRKHLHMSADSSVHSIITDSTSSIMDQGGDSSSAIDSMQPSPLHDSNSISDIPLDALKAARNKDNTKATDEKEIDFKSASRRLFSVNKASGASEKSASVSETRIPKTEDAPSTITEMVDVNSKGSEEDVDMSISQDPLQTQDNIEGGA